MTRQPVWPHRQSRRLVACLLAFTACLLLGSIALTMFFIAAPLDDSPVSASSSNAPATVRLFYEAVNEAIRTGDTTPLDGLVDLSYVEHPDRAGLPPGRDGLYAFLANVRATAPELRIAVESAIASTGGDEVTVRVRVAGIESGSFLGLSPPIELATWGWGPLEIVRVTDGMIAERWTGEDATASFQSVAQAALPPADASVPRVMALLRLTFAPHAEIEIINGLATRLLVVESGKLALTMARTSGEAMDLSTVGLPLPGTTPVPTTPPTQLTAGEHLLTTPSMNYLAANEGESALSVLVAVRYGVGWGMASPGAFIEAVRDDASALSAGGSSGVTAEVLTVAVLPPGEDATLLLGRVQLLPGTTLTWPSSEQEILLGVDRGQIELTTSDPGTTGVRADGQSWAGDSAVLGARDSAHLAPGTGFTWHATGDAPATVLVLTLVARAGDPASLESPSP